MAEARLTAARWQKCKSPETLFEPIDRSNRTSDRVLRLFVAAFWRWQAARLPSGDGDLMRERIDKLETWAETGKPPKGVLPNRSNLAFFHTSARSAAENVVGLGSEWRESAVKTVVCALLRDVFGNPFRPVELDPAWLTSDVRALAKGIYDERAFDRMPILADALQDAGCANEEVLAHCRGEGPHVRGCWVVDLILGKQ